MFPTWFVYVIPIVICFLVLIWFSFFTSRGKSARCRGEAYLLSLIGKSYQCKCGHKAKRKTAVFFDGKFDGVFVLSPKEPKYCPDCWTKAAIRCAWCGEIITPGSPITLYSPKEEDFKIGEGVVVYNKDPLVLVGCLGWNCADAMDRSAFWVMPGRVERVMSPLEMIMSQMSQGNMEPVFVHDLGDMSQAIPFPVDPAKPTTESG